MYSNNRSIQDVREYFYHANNKYHAMDYRNMTDLKFVYMKLKKTIRLDGLSMKNYFVKNTHLQVDKKTSPIVHYACTGR